MMLTRRGGALVVVAAAGIVMAGLFGARSLRAVVGPILVGVAAGYVAMRRTDRPDLRVDAPEYGFRGETERVTLAFDARSPVSATVALDAEDGLAVGRERSATLSETALDFEVELRERGDHRVGPVEVVVRDLFGLWTKTFTYPVSESVVVFPQVRRLDGVSGLSTLTDDSAAGDRGTFDKLREYERGDPLRDVHWKSSAKRAGDDLLVKEFAASEETRRVTVAAGAAEGCADEMADAAASVAAALLDAGVAVGVSVPGGTLAPGTSQRHRTAVLTLLARTPGGSVPDADADVVVYAPAAGDVEVSVERRTWAFGDLADSSGERGATAGVAR